jgi:predicted Zn-dependent protease
MAAEGRDLFAWEIRVIDDPKTINAFALPAGKMAVYTGILPVARDDGGLAVVLGHEVGHAYAQHGRKRISEGVLEQLTLEVAQAALEGQVSPEVQGLIIAGLGIGLSLGVELPFSRDDESAADEIGLILMAEAGYDPREAVGFWERMEAAAGEGPPQFLSTHPSPENRIARLKKLMPKALAVYRAGRSTGAKGAAPGVP